MWQESVDEVPGRRAAGQEAGGGAESSASYVGVGGGWQASPPCFRVSAFPELLKNRHVFHIKGQG